MEAAVHQQLRVNKSARNDVGLQPQCWLVPSDSVFSREWEPFRAFPFQRFFLAIFSPKLSLKRTAGGVFSCNCKHGKGEMVTVANLANQQPPRSRQVVTSPFAQRKGAAPSRLRPPPWHGQSRREPGQLVPAHAAGLPGARGDRVRRLPLRRLPRHRLHLVPDAPAMPPPRLRARVPRHLQRRHRKPPRSPSPTSRGA